MNIIVVGGGTVGKFGNDFCLKARSEGHNVLIFSHKNNGTNDKQQHVIDYNNLEKTSLIINHAISLLSHIDLLLFNQVGGAYPNITDIDTAPNINQYIHTLNAHAIIPHLFLSLCANKLQNAKIVNMSSPVAWNYKKEGFIGTLVGYCAGKSWATHMIQSLAANRKNNNVYFSIAPGMNYDSAEHKEKYTIWLKNLYEFIMSANEEYNGKIFTAYMHSDSIDTIEVQSIWKK